MQLGGAPAQLFDQAREGTADIVWAVPANTPGRFPKIEVFELPFVGSRRALVNSMAIEAFAAANLRDEFRDVHPLCFSCRDRAVLHAGRAMASVADLKGLKFHVPNRLAGEALQALGAQGLRMPVPQVPAAMAQHVIDGCLDPWNAMPALKLSDVLKFHTDFAESALSTTTLVLAMNTSAYDRLPRDLKTVIDNNSGQSAAGMAGAMWDLEAAAIAGTIGERGDPITVIAADDVAPWRKATERVIAAWLKDMKAQKGGKLLASAGAFIAKYAKEPEPQPAPPPERQIVEPREPQAKPAEPAAAPAAKTAPAPKQLDIPL